MSMFRYRSHYTRRCLGHSKPLAVRSGDGVAVVVVVIAVGAGGVGWRCVWWDGGTVEWLHFESVFVKC